MIGLSSSNILAQETINRIADDQHRFLITNFGYKPGERKNVIPSLIAALKVCTTKDSAILVFPKGRYDFWQDFTAL
jgi:hypothetical protein